MFFPLWLVWGALLVSSNIRAQDLTLNERNYYAADVITARRTRTTTVYSYATNRAYAPGKSALPYHHPEPFPVPSSPHAVYQPAVHWDHNVKDLNNLIPVENHDLYYTDNGVAHPAVAHPFAYLKTNLSSPAVVLEHSAFISAVKCEKSGLSVKFSKQDAYDTAKKHWSAHGGFLIVTHNSGCNATNEDVVRAYFSVKSVKFSDLTAHCIAEEVAIENAINEIGMTWGHYKPSKHHGKHGDHSKPHPSKSSTSHHKPKPYDSHHPSYTHSVYHPPTHTYSPTHSHTHSHTPSATGCGAPPAAFIDGFPTAPCGDNFDVTLDDKLGYVSFNDPVFAATLEDIAPGLGDYNLADYEDDDLGSATASRRSPIIKRFSFNPLPFFRKVADVAVNAVKTTANTVTTAVVAGVNDVKDGVKAGVAAVSDAVNALSNPSINTHIPVSIAPPRLVNSPFGPAYQIFADNVVGLYCVSCGITGDIYAQGQISFSLLAGGITAGNVGFNGNVQAGLNIGVYADAKYDKTFTQSIVSVGIPGFTIPKIITIGPVIALDVDLIIDIEATGQILTGATVTIANFAANLDLIDSGKSFSTGFTPVFNTLFRASGQITASADLGLPLTVGVGIDIPALKNGRRLISVKNRPSLVAQAAYQYSTTDPGNCNNGIAYSIHLADDTSIDIFGIKEIDLYNYKSPDLVANCIFLNGAPSPTNTGATEATDPGSDPAGADNPTAGEKARRADPNPNDGTTFADLSADADTDEDSTDTTDAKDGNDGYGFEYITIGDYTGRYILSADDNGNFNLQLPGQTDGGITFASYGDVVVSDDNDRILHYYPETMAKFGVSRFRISTDMLCPKTADVVSLAPLNYDNSDATKGIYLAVNTKGDYYYTVVCNVDGQASKIFLVEEIDKGIKTLMRPDLRYIVTGGVVTECFYIAFVSEGPGLS